MKYALLVAWREYAESARAKGFWISFFLFPLILLLSIQAPVWLEKKATPTRHFVLVDQSGNLASVIESALDRSYQKQVFDALNEYARKNLAAPDSRPAAKDAPSSVLSVNRNVPQSFETFLGKGGKDFYLAQLGPLLRPGAPEFHAPRRRFQEIPLPAEIAPRTGIAEMAEALKPYLRHEKNVGTPGYEGELAAAILIPPNAESLIVRPGAPVPPKQNTPGTVREIQYWSANSSDSSLREEVERAIGNEIRRREYLARGLDAAEIKEVERTYLPFASLDPRKEKGKEAVDRTDVIRQWAPSGFVYLLWVAIFSIMQMLMHNTIEEKSNRIIEVLLSSVTPGELMMGKLLGIAAIGLTMIGVWMVALFGILSWKSGGATEISGQLLTVLKTSNLVPLFSVYFLLGYLLYGACILSLGSVCNTLKEAQSYMATLTMLMMVPLLTMTFIPKDPNGTLARTLSWIPFYTPFTMMNRAMGDPPLIDLIGTLLMLLACTAGALWMAGKIFRIGILRTGQPPRIVELLRWALNRNQ